VLELWQLGDLVIATPFLRAAAAKFDVTVVSKPFGKDLQARFWPDVKVIPFLAPWTAFKHKYRLYAWPWRDLFHLRKEIAAGRFDVGVSARWPDPRDHLLLMLSGVRERFGFPKMGSRMFLTRPLAPPNPEAHRFEYWRVLAQALGFELPGRNSISDPPRQPGAGLVVIHTGAGQPLRVWPMARYHNLAARLRANGFRVQVACDPDQKEWWLSAGEKDLQVPHTVTELMVLLDRAALLIGNDSGPGHLAALAGVPTISLFGPQLPEWFAPLHPLSTWIEGKPCPYKPCFDYCRWQQPICLTNISEEEAWAVVEKRVLQLGIPRAT
jgi:ADP-heptose:LPS heptosyltransferase